MLMGVDVCGDLKIDFFHSMEFYVFKMNNCGNVQEVSNGYVVWMYPQFQEIKDTSIDFIINKMLQACVGKMKFFKGVMRQ